ADGSGDSAHQTNVQSEDVELIKPRKLQNPVKSSRSHQELHRELLSRRGCVEMKPELQRVLESRKREQLIRQRKQEDDAHRKMSPLEAELRKRHDKLDEVRHLRRSDAEVTGLGARCKLSYEVLSKTQRLAGKPPMLGNHGNHVT
uniref:Actin-associated protein FAM107A n=1 Tax=Salarias fasciatus TaxID=181472 RepID=A0A672FWB0_SALFA